VSTKALFERMTEHDSSGDGTDFVHWFRRAAPYINAFRGRTFVLSFGGEVVSEARFPALVHDIALLHSLGVRLVLVHGARPQIEQRLKERGAEMRYVNNLRVTDTAALACVKEAAGTVRVEIEALLSMGLANSPMAGADIQVASGNFVTARPLGVREGVDYQHTGEVRRIDQRAIRERLEGGAIVLLSPVGYSPTGEVFNLAAEDVATAAAESLGADKLICLVDGDGVPGADGALVRELTLTEAEHSLATGKLPEQLAHSLRSALAACRKGVRRAHLINRHTDGALLQELFTRDGVGTLVSGDAFEGTRPATLNDIGGILELIAPLEEEGILVRRSRERLEMEIDHFSVIERDGTVIACAAMYPFPGEQVAELACLVVHPDYQDKGKGEWLLEYTERLAKQQGVKKLFVLTTRAEHWFREQGFEAAELSDLPVEKQALYNWQRKSKVFIRVL
jgi:amino-acid N-acetyltransferase